MKIFVALTLLLTGTAYATGSPPAPEVPDTRTEASASSNAAAVGIAKAEGGNAMASGGTSSASQSQTQSAVSGAEATNAGNSQNLSVESHYREIRQAPASFAPAIYASGPCAYGWSAALSVPGGSVGGGKAKADQNCDRREIVRILTPLNPSLALKVACADPIVASVAAEKDCVYAPPEVVIENTGPPVPAIDLSRYVTREELAERDRRIMRKTVGK